MNQTNDHTPVALYARVSSDRQDVDLSVSAQLRALRDYAGKNGYLVAREYIDEAESGRVANRPEFRKMIDEGSKADAPFEVILVWKFSRFTRKREHAVAFKSMLRRKGVKVVSITEHADDTPTGKLMEAIIESVDEFYSENLAQEVTRGMREAASRGFWVASTVPYGYVKVHVQDGAKKRPRLDLDPGRSAVVRRMFQMVESGRSVLAIAKTLNDEGVASATGKLWSKTMVHYVLSNEAYTGTLVWGTNSSDGAPPVRVEDAFPAIVSKREFSRVGELMRSRAPRKIHPRRISSSYLLSGLVKCRRCRVSLSGHDAKSGRFSYYVCQSLMKRGKDSCNTPRLNSKRFERLVIDEIRGNILAEDNIRDLVRLVDDEMEGVSREHRKRLDSIESELAEVRRWLDRLYRAIETTDLDVSDIAPRIREHRERERKLQESAREVEATLAERRVTVDNLETITAFAGDMSTYLSEAELTERRAFIQSFVKEISVGPGKAIIRYNIPMPDDGSAEGGVTGEVALPESVRYMVRPGTPDLTKSRTEADSDVTPSLGMGTVYVSVASSSITSMPSTKLRMSALRSGIVPSLRKSRKSATYPLISSVVGSSTLRCSSRLSASSFAASSCSSRCLREKMRGDRTSRVKSLVSMAS